jgi:flagella basal body P-ring formation protein FlgA
MINEHADMISKHTRSGMIKINISAALLLLTLLPCLAIGAGFQSHASIQNTASQHILDQSDDYPSNPEVIPGRLDNRLRLKQCDQPLESYTPQGKRKMGRVTVGVRCNGTIKWTLFVPVTVKVMAEIVVSKNNLPRGSIINPEDIAIERRDISRLHRGYLENKEAAVGKKLRQRVRQNQVLTPSQLIEPLSVKRNNRVLIQASNETVQVRMIGKALQNGSLGQIIRVKNESSNREIDAKIIAPGIVQVPM